MHRSLFISGGAVKISFLAAIAIGLVNKLRFKRIVGVSSGSILAFVLAVGKLKEAKERVLTFSVPSFLSNNPFSLFGKLKMFHNAVTGKHFLNDHEPLKKMLSEVVTEKDFYKWVKNKNKPEAYVGVVCIETGEKKYVNIKECSYERALNWVIASASIPFNTKGVEMDGKNWFDGGNRDHIGSAHFLKNEGLVDDEIYSVFSRPKDLSNQRFKIPKKSTYIKVAGLYLSLLLLSFPALFIGQNTIGLIGTILTINITLIPVLMRIVEIFNWEISKTDESEADLICERVGIKQKKFFAPELLTTSLYNTSVKQNLSLYNTGTEVLEQVLTSE